MGRRNQFLQESVFRRFEYRGHWLGVDDVPPRGLSTAGMDLSGGPTLALRPRRQVLPRRERRGPCGERRCFVLAHSGDPRALPTRRITRSRRLARHRSEQVAAALFAVHPLRVEVVAWVSAQSYLPAILCSMLSVLAYLRACAPRQAPSRTRWMVVAWMLSIVAMLFKAVAVTRYRPSS